MHTLRILAVCVGLTFTSTGIADPNVEFTEAFKAYRDAMDRSYYAEAVGHAEKARGLAEEIYADDAKVIANLTLNHGYALAMSGVDHQAYAVLKEARKLIRRAYGPDSTPLLQVEEAMFYTVPEDGARRQLVRLLKQARRQLAKDGEAMAELKLRVGTRVWWNRRAEALLNEAAETFARLGNTEREARAKFWIGKIHLARRQFRRAVEAMTPVVELLPNDDRVALMARANLVEAYERLGESNRATEHCLAIGETVPVTGSAEYLPLFKSAPTYPRSALFRNVEAYVVLEFTVDEMGFVRDPEVIESMATDGDARAFEVAAAEAAVKFRYAPQFIDGLPVAVGGVRNRIVFEIAP